MKVTIVRRVTLSNGVFGVAFTTRGDDQRDTMFRGSALVGPDGAFLISLWSLSPMSFVGTWTKRDAIAGHDEVERAVWQSVQEVTEGEGT